MLCRAVPNFFHLGGGQCQVENMAALQPFTLGWFGSMLLQEILVILGMLRCILVHSAAAHRAS